MRVIKVSEDERDEIESQTRNGGLVPGEGHSM